MLDCLCLVPLEQGQVLCRQAVRRVSAAGGGSRIRWREVAAAIRWRTWASHRSLRHAPASVSMAIVTVLSWSRKEKFGGFCSNCRPPLAGKLRLAGMRARAPLSSWVPQLNAGALDVLALMDAMGAAAAAAAAAALAPRGTPALPSTKVALARRATPLTPPSAPTASSTAEAGSPLSVPA